MKKYMCPCCGYLTLENSGPGSFDICPVCYWEDDRLQAERSDLRGGANEVSLNEARINFKLFGACAEKYMPLVRKPNEDEIS